MYGVHWRAGWHPCLFLPGASTDQPRLLAWHWVLVHLLLDLASGESVSPSFAQELVNTTAEVGAFLQRCIQPALVQCGSLFTYRQAISVVRA